jgi:hypothetical protein
MRGVQAQRQHQRARHARLAGQLTALKLSFNNNRGEGRCCLCGPCRLPMMALPLALPPSLLRATISGGRGVARLGPTKLETTKVCWPNRVTHGSCNARAMRAHAL